MIVDRIKLSSSVSICFYFSVQLSLISVTPLQFSLYWTRPQRIYRLINICLDLHNSLTIRKLAESNRCYIFIQNSFNLKTCPPRSTSLLSFRLRNIRITSVPQQFQDASWLAMKNLSVDLKPLITNEEMNVMIINYLFRSPKA